jgi:hypothetical protein
MEEFDFFYFITFILPVVLGGFLVWLYKSKKIFNRNSHLFVIGWNFLLTLVLLSGLFFVGESYFRFFVDSTDSFALSKLSQRWMSRYYHPNNLSARDNIDYNLAISPGKRRVTIIGDSFTAGHGIKNVDDRYGNLLRKAYPNLEVHVMAINGASSLTGLEILQKLENDHYQFDIILLSYCLNDIDYLMPETHDIFQRIYDFDKTLGYFGKESYLINTLKFKLFAINDANFLMYSNFVLKAYENDSWIAHKKVLNSIRKFSELKGSAFAVVTFPFLQVNKADYAFLGVHQKLNEFWKSKNVLHLDLLETYEPLMGNSLTVNKYDAHPNELANELAARKIGAFLKTN